MTREEYVLVGYQSIDTYAEMLDLMRVSQVAKKLNCSTKGLVDRVPDDCKWRYRGVWLISTEWVHREMVRIGTQNFMRRISDFGVTLSSFGRNARLVDKAMTAARINTDTIREKQVKKALAKLPELPPIHFEGDE